MTEPTTSPRSHTNGRVLAAIDQSAYSESIAHYAAWAAQRLGAPLEFLHVLDRHPETTHAIDASGSLDLDEQAKLLDGLTAFDETRSRLAKDGGRLLLQQATGIANHFHGVSAETRLRHGSLVDTLTELEPGVRLFVMGKRGEHADFAKGHLGSQLERVVRAVHRPLLMASRSFTDVQRVLIAFDGSPTTRKGVEMVAASPLFRQLAVRVVMVGSDTDAHREALNWALEALSSAGLRAEGSILAGAPDEIISGLVDTGEADLLVMGAYGHSRIRHLIVGSTTTALLRTCRVPVLLLR